MIQVLLLDLDGTLLAADINEFLPAYMESLATALTEFAEPEAIISNLMASTQAMIANLDPTRTLKQAFDGRFFPALGRQPSELRDTVDDFYAGQYGQLKALTAPVEGARRLVDQASLAGLQMVVATNPLFPLTAIEQRLAWAGFAAHDSPFELISSYETFHFAKPNPAYYAEILGRLGVASHEAAVVGDDPINDLEPASALGVAAYHVAKNPDDGWPGGPLEQAWTWLQSQAGDEVRPQAGNRPTAVLARFRGYLAALLQLTAQTEESQWDQPPGEREWAPVEIVCHLRDTELEVNQARLQKMLVEEAPFLSAADPDRWADERNYRHQDPHAALARFTKARQETIAQLVELDEAGWARSGRHAIFGPTTLAELMGLAADHDLVHLGQLRRTLLATSA